MDAETKDFLKGMIVLWSGSVASIPGGWALCNGSNGTPDLRNRFVVGAGDTYAVDATGGSINHQHTGTTDGHTHIIDAGAMIDAGAGPMGNETVSSNDTFTTANADGRPPYYALAYIMKL